jgi:histone-lysine N-methyltransferase SETMAR
LFVPLDEYWFSFREDFERQWLPGDEPPADRVQSMVSSPRVMLTVVWNTEGFHIINVIPKGAMFGTDYYCEDILSEILRACPLRSNRRLVIHADSARPPTSKRTGEFMEKNSLRGTPHPPFSPDLSPSDFFFFGQIKSKLQGTEFTEKNYLLQKSGRF